MLTAYWAVYLALKKSDVGFTEIRISFFGFSRTERAGEASVRKMTASFNWKMDSQHIMCCQSNKKIYLWLIILINHIGNPMSVRAHCVSGNHKQCALDVYLWFSQCIWSGFRIWQYTIIAHYKNGVSRILVCYSEHKQWLKSKYHSNIQHLQFNSPYFYMEKNCMSCMSF